MKQSKSVDLADILFPSEDQINLSDSILSIPPEMRRLHTETYDFTVSTLMDQIEQKRVYIPKYQRRYVWTNSQASRLVESLIIQCPIPVIYLAQDKEERLAVIDGNQRINSLRRYIKNEFPLTGLTAYPELENLRFFELDGRFQRHIENRTLRCLVILKETHPQVKFDVFERLNSGSVRLTPQELRHGIYYGSFMKKVEDWAKNPNFVEMLSIQHEKRMKAQELVVRFLAFKYDLKSYKKPLSGFLNSSCEKYNKMPDDELEEMGMAFTKVVSVAKNLFGEQAFMIIDKNFKILSKFNAALFDAEMHIADLIASGKKRAPKTGEAKKLVIDLIESSEDFRKAISRSTSDETQVLSRLKSIEEVF